MSDRLDAAAKAINEHFAQDHPGLFARRVEALAPDDGADTLAGLPDASLLRVWERLSPDIARDFIGHLPEEKVRVLLAGLSPTALVNTLARVPAERREDLLAVVGSSVRQEIESILEYPEGSAGRSMDPRFVALRPTDTVGDALAQLRQRTAAVEIYTVDDDMHLRGRVSLEKLALTEPETRLGEIAQPVALTVLPVQPMEDVVEAFESQVINDLPVVDVDGRLIGHFHHSTMAAAVQSDTTADMQTMVGASRDERALSPVVFAVRKRMGWLQINLLTAFMAAAVVGLFEGTIAKFTALAVLLPVVAGQSGNAGAQALAVTMRGLALREITLRHWLKVTWKEANVGLLNGLSIALTCGIGVFVWSGSIGLVMVITLSMVLAMIAAGLAGAMVPIILTRLGQDPATASSIILTTVTDIAGFFSFLGIATLFMSLL